jgi:hypothetical protein
MGNPHIQKLVLVCSLTLLVYLARFSGITDSTFTQKQNAVFENVLRSLQTQTHTANWNSACQSGEISPNLTLSASDAQQAENARNVLNAMVPGNPLKDIIYGKSSDYNGYAMGMIITIAPWIVLCLISLIGCTCCCYNFCCIHCCCKNCCNCCTCCKAPKFGEKKILLMILATVLLAGTAGTSIAGFVFSQRILSEYDTTNCAVASFIDDIVNGNLPLHFMGLTPASTLLNTMSAQVGQTINSLNTVDTTGQSYVSGNITNLITGISNMQSAYSTMKVVNSDYGNATLMYPDMISNLGPYDTSNTSVCGSMRAEAVVKNSTVVSQVNALNSNVASVKSSASSIQSAIASGASALTTISTQMGTLANNMGDYSSQGRQYIWYANIALNVLYAIALAMATVAISAMLLIKCCKAFNKLNCFLYFACFWLSLIMIIGFLISALLFPSSVLFMQVCGVLNDVITVNGTLSKIDSLSSSTGNSSVANYINTCLWGNGDIISQVTNGNLGSLTGISNSLNTLGNFTPGNANTSVTIPMYSRYVQQYIAGTLAVSTSVNAGFPLYSLQTLNQYVNYSYPNTKQTGCQVTQDQIQLSSKNCTPTSVYVLKTSDSATTNMNSGACIGVADFASSTTVVTSRYSSPDPYSSCSPDNSAAVVNSYNQITAHFNDESAKFNTMYNDATNGWTALNALDQKVSYAIWNLTAPITALNNSINTFMTQLNDPNVGLIPNLNCTIIGFHVNRLYVDLCDGMITNLYQSALVMALCCCFTILGVLFLFCLAKRNLIPSRAEAAQSKAKGGDDKYNQYNPNPAYNQ